VTKFNVRSRLSAICAWHRLGKQSRRFLYIWADGVYFKPRMAEEKQCVLVIVGIDDKPRWFVGHSPMETNYTKRLETRFVYCRGQLKNPFMLRSYRTSQESHRVHYSQRNA